MALRPTAVFIMLALVRGIASCQTLAEYARK